MPDNVRRMKFRLLPIVLVVAACSGPIGREFGSGAAGVNVADAALRGGSPQVALQVVSGVLKNDPNNTEALLIEGDALTLLGRNEAAAKSFEHALSRSPSSDRGLIGLGRLRLATDPMDAERLFLLVLQKDPTNTTALNNLGIARDLQGRHRDAQLAYRQALGQNPDMTAAQVNLALSLAMDGQGASAISLIQPLAIAPDASRKVRHDYAAVLALSGRRAEAEQILSADLTRAEVAQALAEYDSVAQGGRTPPQMPPAKPRVMPFQGSSREPLPSQPIVTVAQGAAPEARQAAARPSPTSATAGDAAPVAGVHQASPAVVRPSGPAIESEKATQSVASLAVLPASTSAEPATEPTSRTPDSAAPAEITAAAAQPAGAARSRSVIIRIGRSESRQAAQESWAGLRTRMPSDTAGLTSHPIKSHKATRAWSLRVSGFADDLSAHAFCEKLHASGDVCVVTSAGTDRG